MKTLLFVLGGALALLHLILSVVASTPNPLAIHIVTALIGAAIAIASLSLKTKSPPSPLPPAQPAPSVAPERREPAPTVIEVPPAPAAPVHAAPARKEAEIVAFLALLQEKGRLVDFLREEIAGATDDQVGTAARVVHAGCRSVLNEYLEIVPVRPEAEGARITLAAGYDAPAHRLLGSVAAQPPYTGTLLHPGWAVRAVKLPRVTGTTPERPWPVLAPAEVQLNAP